MMRNQFMRTILSVILSFFLALMIAGIFMTAGVYLGLYNQRMILAGIQKSNLYEAGYEDMLKLEGILLEETGIPVSCVEEVFTLKKYYIEKREFIIAVMSGKEWQAESGDLSVISLENSLRRYYEEQKLIVTDDLQKEIHAIAVVLERQYSESMSFGFLDSLFMNKSKTGVFVAITVPILAAAAALLVFLLAGIYRHRYRSLRYVAFSLLGAAIIIAAASLFLYKKDYGLLVSKNGSYREFIRYYTSHIALTTGAGVLLGLVLFAGVILWISILKNKIKNSGG